MARSGDETWTARTSWVSRAMSIAGIATFAAATRRGVREGRKARIHRAGELRFPIQPTRYGRRLSGKVCANGFAAALTSAAPQLGDKLSAPANGHVTVEQDPHGRIERYDKLHPRHIVSRSYRQPSLKS
jgi:hypothetical protein